MVQESTRIDVPCNGCGQGDRGSGGIRGIRLPQFPKQAVNGEAKEQREQNEASEPHLKTKRFGWIGSLGGIFNFAIEWFGG